METQNKSLQTPESSSVPRPVISAPESGATAGGRPRKFSHETFRVLLIIAIIADVIIGCIILYLFILGSMSGDMGGLVFLFGMIALTVLGIPAGIVTSLFAIGYAATDPKRDPVSLTPVQTIQPTNTGEAPPPKSTQ